MMYYINKRGFVELEQHPDEADVAYLKRLAAFLSNGDARSKADMREFVFASFHLNREVA